MLRALVAGLALGLCAGACAQEAEPSPATAALKDGRVNVWLVTPGNEAERARANAIAAARRIAKYGRAPGYSESTAGTFGTAASNVGQNAGSAGQTAGSFGTNASNVGTNAGSYGKRTDDPSISAPDSQTAGSYGQTAGSFGQASSTYGQRLSGEPLGPPPATARARPDAEVHNRQREALAVSVVSSLRSDLYPAEDLNIHVESVATEELSYRLQTVATEDYPDVLLTPSPHPLGADSGAEVRTLGWPGALDGGNPLPDAEQGQPRPAPWRSMWPTILLKAPHPAQARAFLLWVREMTQCRACPTPAAAAKIPTRIATDAVVGILSGGGLGASADPDAAKFDTTIAQNLALLGTLDGEVGGLTYRTDVDYQGSLITDNLAVIAVRTIASSETAFGATHSAVVLRKDEKGRWKVLQVSANEGFARGQNEEREWAAVGGVKKKTRLAAVKTEEDDTAVPAGVSLAGPVDGDTRSPMPELWWDNLGGAALQVVEWQWRAPKGRWTDPRLMLVPDHDFHVRTQATATFAELPGVYRWRVWSVAKGGALKLSDWRSMEIIR